MTRLQTKFEGPPKKTVWTVAWFAVLGIAVFVVLRLTRDSESTDLDQTAAPWNEQIVLPDEDDLSIPDPDELGRKRLEPRTPHQAIEDPSQSLCGFYRGLKTLDDRKADNLDEKVRILHYGDSILTTDELSGRVRRTLQRRFGDGGHGFILLGKPWRWYHHLDVNHGANRKWTPRPLSSDPVKDGLFGLGGVAFETNRKDARAWAGTVSEGPVGREASSFDISYLEQPRGGSFDIYLNGKLYQTLSTSNDEVAVRHHRLDAPPGASTLTLQTRGDGEVRLFGAVLESDDPGVVYDSLAINGVRASLFNRFDKTHWRSELRRREASLVIFMCGANEGNNDELALGYYKTQLTGVIRDIQSAVPNAGCLIVGPLDQAMRGDDGKLVSKRMPRKLTKAQREVSLNNQCAFFNTYEAMGGKDSMAKWYRRGLGGGDFIHPTEHGARKIGTWLAEALLAGYENYIADGEQCESNVTTL